MSIDAIYYQLSSAPFMTLSNLRASYQLVTFMELFWKLLKSTVLKWKAVSADLYWFCARFWRPTIQAWLVTFSEKFTFFLQILKFTIINSIENQRRYLCAERCLKHHLSYIWINISLHGFMGLELYKTQTPWSTSYIPPWGFFFNNMG